VTYGQPLYSTLAEWAWGGGISWTQQVSRIFSGGLLTDFDPMSGHCVGVSGATRDDAQSCRYRTDNLAGSYTVTRSWGAAYKHDLTVGMSASRHHYSAYAFPDPAEQQAFQSKWMPRSDNVIAPYVEYHDYSSRFVDVLDFETLALTENFRRGHEIIFRVTPVTTALRSSRNFIGLFGALAYTVPLGDGLVRGIVQGSAEIGTDASPPADQGRVPDASVEAGLRIVTPRFKVGRLVFDTHVLDRARNYLNALTSLGGDSRLRGYPSAAFVGKDFFSANLEFRSRPFEILSVDIAGAAFFDTGDAFDDFAKVRLKHSAGVGARIEFPQLERTVMRFDWGFPLTLVNGPGLPTRSFPGDVVVTFGQAFGVPVIPTGN
jgi:hypothetical protein